MKYCYIDHIFIKIFRLRSLLLLGFKLLKFSEDLSLSGTQGRWYNNLEYDVVVSSLALHV